MTKFSSAPVVDDQEVNDASLEDKVSRLGGSAVGSVELAGVPRVEVRDMRDKNLNEVETKINELLSNDDAVVTGSGVDEDGVIEEFDPYRSSLDGKKPSIYATDDPETAIFNAILDKRSPVAIALRVLDGGEGASSRMHVKEVGSPKFQIPQHMAEAIQTAIKLGPDGEEWKNLFRDGAVYVLPKGKFSQDSPMIDGAEYPTDHEWNSQEVVTPGLAVLVSAELVGEVLRFDGEDANVEIIPVDEAEVLSGFRRDMDAVIPEGKAEFSVDELMAMANGSEERLEFAEALKQKVGSASLPREQFVEMAADLYEERVKEQAKAV